MLWASGRAPVTVIGESRLRAGFDEGALVFDARGGS